MTIAQAAEGVWHAVCDHCGDTLLLEPRDPEADADELAEILIDAGWAHKSPERVSFKSSTPRYSETYEDDACPDCAAGGAPQAMLRRRTPAPLPVVRDAFANDPCDPWEKLAIYQAVGLRACGHRKGALPCPACQYEADTGRPYRCALA